MRIQESTLEVRDVVRRVESIVHRVTGDPAFPSAAVWLVGFGECEASFGHRYCDRWAKTG